MKNSGREGGRGGREEGAKEGRRKKVKNRGWGGGGRGGEGGGGGGEGGGRDRRGEQMTRQVMKHREEREELAVTGEQLFVWAESALISELQPPSREPLCKQYRNPGPGTASPSLFSNSSWGRFSSPYTSFNAGMTFVQQSSIWWWKSFSVESNSSITLDLCCRTEELGGGGREGGEGGAGGRDCVSTTTSCWAAEIGMEDKLHSRILWPNLAYFYYWIARNFQGRKLSRISQFCGYPRKFSLQNLGAWSPLAQHKWTVFSAKIIFFTNREKFSSLKFSHFYYYKRTYLATEHSPSCVSKPPSPLSTTASK